MIMSPNTLEVMSFRLGVFYPVTAIAVVCCILRQIIFVVSRRKLQLLWDIVRSLLVATGVSKCLTLTHHSLKPIPTTKLLSNIQRKKTSIPMRHQYGRCVFVHWPVWPVRGLYTPVWHARHVVRGVII